MRHLDWAIMIARLNKEMTIKEIGDKTGINPVIISKVKNESASIYAWDSAITLLDLYIKNLGNNVPRIGDWNE